MSLALWSSAASDCAAGDCRSQRGGRRSFVQAEMDAASESMARQSANGVFKMLKPGIEDRLELELDLLRQVGAHLDERCHDAWNSAPGIRRVCSSKFATSFSSEVRLERRATAFDAGGGCLCRRSAGAHSCATSEHCTPRVTAMERITGGKITDHRLDHFDRRSPSVGFSGSSARLAVRFSRAPSQAMFHGDPHAGNLFLTDENRLAIFDWSLVGSLGERDASGDRPNHAGGRISLNAGRIVRLLLRTRRASPTRPRSRWSRLCDNRLRGFGEGKFPGLQLACRLLDEAVQTAGLRLGGRSDVVPQIAAHAGRGIAEMGADKLQIDDILLSNFSAISPRNGLAAGFRRRHRAISPLRLSNLDLTRHLLNYPAIATRFWLGQSCGLLDAYCGSG